MKGEMPNKAYFSNLSDQCQREVAQRTEKYDVLKNLDLFILDNSIRESTVGKEIHMCLLRLHLSYLTFFNHEFLSSSNSFQNLDTYLSCN